MPGLIRGVARTAVVAGTATAVSNRVSRRQYNRWAAPFAAAVRRSGAQLVARGGIPLDALVDALDEAEAAQV